MSRRDQMRLMAESNEADPCVSNLPLVIGISTRALFDLEEEHAVFENEGVLAYSELQRERERRP